MAMGEAHGLGNGNRLTGIAQVAVPIRCPILQVHATRAGLAGFLDARERDALGADHVMPRLAGSAVSRCRAVSLIHAGLRCWPLCGVGRYATCGVGRYAKCWQ